MSILLPLPARFLNSMGCGSNSPSQLRPVNESKSGGGVRDLGERGERGDIGERWNFQVGDGKSRDRTISLSVIELGDGGVGRGMVGLDLGSNRADKLGKQRNQTKHEYRQAVSDSQSPFAVIDSLKQ